MSVFVSALGEVGGGLCIRKSLNALLEHLPGARELGFPPGLGRSR